MNWSDILRAAAAFFLVAAGLGVAYVCFQLGALLAKLAGTVVRVTDGAVPILERAQGTVDGINQQLTHVDTIMTSAVGATKGAERAVGTVANAVASPARKLSGLTAKLQEQVRTFKARRDARADDGAPVATDEPLAQGASPGWSPPPPVAPSDGGPESTPVATATKGGSRTTELPYPAAPNASANGATRP